MTLLWPGLPQKSAQANLRQTLYLLNQAVPEVQARTEGETVPLLLADRGSIQINPEARFELDVARFESLLAGPLEGWPEAVSLFQQYSAPSYAGQNRTRAAFMNDFPAGKSHPLIVIPSECEGSLSACK